MTSTLFFHKDCGGNLIVDASKIFQLTTPSLSVGIQGVKLGVMELEIKELPKSGIVFKCSSCEESLDTMTDSKNIEVECQICQVKHSVSDIYVSVQIPYICEDCRNLALKPMRTEKLTKLQERCMKVLSMIPTSGLNRSVKLVDILKQKITTM